MLAVFFFVAACNAVPKHESNRQTLNAEGWKAFSAKVYVKIASETTTPFTKFKKFFIVDEVVTWDAAKSSCESIGAKLAEPKTEEQAKFLGGLMGNGYYWIGGTCSGCSKVDEDKWRWVSGGKISLANPMWGVWGGKQSPWDHEDGPHDAFFLGIARESKTGNKLVFTNFSRDANAISTRYICESV